MLQYSSADTAPARCCIHRADGATVLAHYGKFTAKIQSFHRHKQFGIIFKISLILTGGLATCSARASANTHRALILQIRINCKYISYFVSVRHSVVWYTIDVNRRQTKHTYKTMTSNLDSMLGLSVKMGYTAAYTEIGMAWYTNMERSTGITRNAKYKYNNPNIYPTKHMQHSAPTMPESVGCW